MASGGYPGSYETGYEITGIDAAEAAGAAVFHAGTALKEGKLVTAGGRVLGVTAQGKDLREAQSNAYAAVKKIDFKAVHYRNDIAAKSLGSAPPA
jgi:phosphoribosylamine--glycine ligase